MERRREPRSAFNQPVWITALAGSEARFAGTGIDLSGNGMRVIAECPLPPNTPVKIETGDSLYLAEVCYCAPQEDRFMIGLVLDQVLKSLPDLAQLRRHLVEDTGYDEPARELPARHLTALR